MRLKERIKETVENYQNKPSLAEEILYSTKDGSRGEFNADNKHTYFSTLSEMYQSNNEKKCRRELLARLSKRKSDFEQP
jgi:hypothetical protein